MLNITIREMQIKTSVKYQLTPVRMDIPQKPSTNNKCLIGCGEKNECKLVQPVWRIVRSFLKKTKIELLYDPEIPILAYIQTKP